MALDKVGKLDKVELVYPVRGYSFMACDRDSSLIKIKRKRIERLYLIEEILNLILNVSSNPSKFSLYLMKHDAFVIFSIWWPSYYKKSCLSNSPSAKKIRQNSNYLLIIPRSVIEW